MNLLDEREARTKRRKDDKKRHDSEISLSYNEETKQGVAKLKASVKKPSDTTARLLDEGAIEGDGWIDCFIKKGTIDKFMNGENQYLDNIDDDFEGHVNLGHFDFATFPYIIGNWKKEDLHVVDTDNGRKALDVDLHLDEDSIFVQELARQPYDIGISAELSYHLDWEATMDLGFEVIDEIFIKAYGLVGECGNVNSDGLELKGIEDMEETKNLQVTEAEESKDISKEEEPKMAKESIEETAEDKETEDTKEESESNDEVEEVEDEEVSKDEEVIDDEDEEDEDESKLSVVFKQANERIESLEAEVNSLKEENAALKKQNKKLSKRLAAKNEEIEKFANKFKGLSISLGLKKEEKEQAAPEVEHKLYAGSDGIGE